MRLYKKLTVKFLESSKILERKGNIVYKLHLFIKNLNIIDTSTYNLLSKEEYEVENIINFKIKYYQSYYLIK